MKTFITSISVWLLSLAASAQAAEDIAGRVVSVTDGDTITILTASEEQVKVRLYGIDCPESRQSFGTKAKQFTSSQCFGKEISVRVRDKDRYGRTVGEVLLPNGENLNLAILKNGYAWWYQYYAPKEKEYEKREKAAKSAKSGLWADKDSVAPWDFRKGVRSAESAKSGSGEKKAMAYWMTISSKKRHNSSCRYFKNSKGKVCGPKDGIACKICGG